jgi:hypothetical protein
MVVNGKTEKEHFKDALNARVADKHPEQRGRPIWLYDQLQAYRKTHRKFFPITVSKQICAYWLKGEKLPTGERLQLLCAALDMTRGQLFGESHDPRLSLIIKRWGALPEHLKRSMHSMVDDQAETPEESPLERAETQRATR